MFMLAWKNDSHKQYIYMIEFSLKVEYHRKGNWWYDNEWLNRNFMYPCNQVESTGQAQPTRLSWTQPISARLKTRPSGGLLRSARWSKLSHGLHRPARQRIGPNAAHRGHQNQLNQPKPLKGWWTHLCRALPSYAGSLQTNQMRSTVHHCHKCQWYFQNSTMRLFS